VSEEVVQEEVQGAGSGLKREARHITAIVSNERCEGAIETAFRI